MKLASDFRPQDFRATPTFHDYNGKSEQTVRPFFLNVVALLSLAIIGSDGIAQSPTGVTPVSGFLSPSKYTNAYFGFSLPLAQDVPFRDFYFRSHDADRYELFGVQAVTANGLSTMNIWANRAPDGSTGVRNAASGPEHLKTRKSEIGGKQFWESETVKKNRAGVMHAVSYTAFLDGYILQFEIVSFDAQVTDKLRASVEGIEFFNPGRAQQMAGLESRPYPWSK